MFNVITHKSNCINCMGRKYTKVIVKCKILFYMNLFIKIIRHIAIVLCNIKLPHCSDNANGVYIQVN